MLLGFIIGAAFGAGVGVAIMAYVCANGRDDDLAIAQQMSRNERELAEIARNITEGNRRLITAGWIQYLKTLPDVSQHEIEQAWRGFFHGAGYLWSMLRGHQIDARHVKMIERELSQFFAEDDDQ